MKETKDKIREIMAKYWLQETDNTERDGLNPKFQDVLIGWNQDYGDLFLDELNELVEREIENKVASCVKPLNEQLMRQTKLIHERYGCRKEGDNMKLNGNIKAFWHSLPNRMSLESKLDKLDKFYVKSMTRLQDEVDYWAERCQKAEEEIASLKAEKETWLALHEKERSRAQAYKEELDKLEKAEWDAKIDELP